MSQSIAIEAQRIVRDAAYPVPAGETIKGQLRRAARALGYPDGSWRIRTAWYGEASSWSATALEQLRHRHRLWADRRASREANDADRIAALAERLGVTDQDFHGDEIARLLDLARRLRAPADGEVNEPW